MTRVSSFGVGGGLNHLLEVFFPKSLAQKPSMLGMLEGSRCDHTPVA